MLKNDNTLVGRVWNHNCSEFVANVQKMELKEFVRRDLAIKA